MLAKLDTQNEVKWIDFSYWTTKTNCELLVFRKQSYNK